MKRILIVTLLAVLLMCGVSEAQNIFNCTSFSSSGTCSYSGGFRNSQGCSNLSGSAIALIPGTCSTHISSDMVFQTKVNVQAFTTNFTFVPNGQNIAFSIQNNNNNPGFDGANFSGGAGCEGGFFQAFAANAPPNNIFAIMLDSYGTETPNGAFTFSNAQVYQMAQSPCNPNDSGPNYYGTNKLSTSPVPLNSPSNTQNTSTGDVYSATIGYDGTNLSLCLFDVTLAAGSCSSATSGTGTFFQKTWTAINLPSIVQGNTAWVMMAAAIGTIGAPGGLLVDSWSYTVDTPPANQSFSTYTASLNSGVTPVSAPTYSPAAGTYSGAQTVTVSSPTSGSYICYALGTTIPAFLPQPDNVGGCNEGTLYTGPISIASSQTLYTMAGLSWTASGATVPSSLTVGSFTIGGSGAANTPSCTPTSGSSGSPITVTCTNSNSGTTVMCGTEDGSTPVTAGNGTTCTHGTVISSTVVIGSTVTTLEVIAGTSTLSDSAVFSAGPYTISTVTPVISSGVSMIGITNQ